MRGLRINIDKFVDGLEVCVFFLHAIIYTDIFVVSYEPNLVNFCSLKTWKGLNFLCSLYSKQGCTITNVESFMTVSSSSSRRLIVVPHKFQGIFITKNKEDLIYNNNNLRLGEASFGEELITCVLLVLGS